MRTDEERVAELHLRMKTLKQSQLRRKYLLTGAAACIACIAVTVLLALSVARLPAVRNNMPANSVAASIFATHQALGYVVVALVALCLGSLVTVFCFRLKRHITHEEKHDG